MSKTPKWIDLASPQQNYGLQNCIQALQAIGVVNQAAHQLALSSTVGKILGHEDNEIARILTMRLVAEIQYEAARSPSRIAELNAYVRDERAYAKPEDDDGVRASNLRSGPEE